MLKVCFTAHTEFFVAANTQVCALMVTAHTLTPLRVVRWGVHPVSTSVQAEQVDATLVKMTTAGAGSTTNPITIIQPATASVTATAVRGPFTTSPTPGVVLDVAEVHLQGSYDVMYPDYREREISGGERVGIQLHCAHTFAVRTKLEWRE